MDASRSPLPRACIPELYVLTAVLSLAGLGLGFALGFTSPTLDTAVDACTSSNRTGGCPECLNCELGLSLYEVAAFVSGSVASSPSLQRALSSRLRSRSPWCLKRAAAASRRYRARFRSKGGRRALRSAGCSQRRQA